MNNIAGAIGLAQMDKLPGFLTRRRAIDNIYREAFSDLKWLTLPPSIPSNYQSSYYTFWLQTKYRDSLARYLLENGVYTTFRYWPLHKIKFFSKEAGGIFNLPGAENASQNTLNIPLHQSLTDEEVTKIIDLIRRFKP